ncbi:hypothetical protein FANTH_10059 [Fusarium anthophilum]|uniref:Uncharacterized protein n=1 Tax=Fusarium anthophilum TaxID=48485 RepID=A0A8H4Z4I2_9HYPO|nr:hypothetical protein FANTH_10059 [Fusarium anthophilum]
MGDRALHSPGLTSMRSMAMAVTMKMTVQFLDQWVRCNGLNRLAITFSSREQSASTEELCALHDRIQDLEMELKEAKRL